eukprot:TRINITY_DN19808_c0_g1_i1.p1 TRINITY_DN19808_c0_g1~~TRINITY_DN19808_c0_g1_i1.p1  ORF type:complete len:337 (+),score=45.82 TRINITY_DN19808_c0_g1_i1:62-1072(+)
MNLLYNFTPQNVKPSFFELFLESQMIGSLKPAFEYVASVIAQNNPVLIPLLNYSDEIFYIVVAVLERHYLKHYDGSFSENFYGLKREIVTKDGKKGPPIQRKHKLWSIFFLAVVPYIKTKLDTYYTNNGETRNQGQKSLLKVVFQSLYPYLAGVYESLIFIYQLLYMYNYSDYFSPFLHLQGLTIQRQTVNDLLRHTRKDNLIKKQRQASGPMLQLWYFLVDRVKNFLDMSAYILPGAIFFFKFLEWWYNEPRFEKPPEVIPPPPDPPQIPPKGIPIPVDKSLCPICTKIRTNPAMSSSGFTFCYPCLFKFVESHNRCPVTLVPMEVGDIRKLYDS